MPLRNQISSDFSTIHQQDEELGDSGTYIKACDDSEQTVYFVSSSSDNRVEENDLEFNKKIVHCVLGFTPEKYDIIIISNTKWKIMSFLEKKTGYKLFLERDHKPTGNINDSFSYRGGY